MFVSASDDGDRLRVLEKRLVRPETYLELIIVEFCPHLTMMLTAGTTSPLPHIWILNMFNLSQKNTIMKSGRPTKFTERIFTSWHFLLNFYVKEVSWLWPNHFRHSDQVKIFAGDSNGQDFWGMEDFQFVLNDCSRSTKSFERGPTAFIANINGPIRAIR